MALEMRTAEAMQVGESMLDAAALTATISGLEDDAIADSLGQLITDGIVGQDAEDPTKLVMIRPFALGSGVQAAGTQIATIALEAGVPLLWLGRAMANRVEASAIAVQAAAGTINRKVDISLAEE